MKTVSGLAILVAIFTVLISSTASTEDGLRRSKRSVFQFGHMVQCAASNAGMFSAFKTWSDYDGYGCWCGKGGQGQPVDDIDRCCMNHDYCYRGILRSDSSADIYWGRYRWDCNSGAIKCENRYGTWKYKLCDCDRTASKCFARGSYNPSNKGLRDSGGC